MKASKKGISLIVLIITIVVIIILAAAIILNLTRTNVVNNANTATSKSNLDSVQSAVTLAYGDAYATAMQSATGTLPTPASILETVRTNTGLTNIYWIDKSEKLYDLSGEVTGKNIPTEDYYTISEEFAVNYIDRKGNKVILKNEKNQGAVNK